MGKTFVQNLNPVEDNDFLICFAVKKIIPESGLIQNLYPRK